MLVDAFLEVGVSKVRLTGGEPLLRPGLPELIRDLVAKDGLRELAMTTNAVLLPRQAGALKQAGLTRLTISLDTLRPDRFAALTRRSSHAAVIAGIRSAADAGFRNTKIDTVVTRGVNEDELTELIEFGRQVGAEVRFIEYMDVPGATRWQPELVVSRAEILDRVARTYGRVDAVERTGSAPAERFVLPDGRSFGIISSTTQPFCASCDRGRLTADGRWYSCLYALTGTDLRQPLRSGASRQELAERITGLWTRRADQGAVLQLARRAREGHVSREALQADPHLEMHTRGG